MTKSTASKLINWNNQTQLKDIEIGWNNLITAINYKQLTWKTAENPQMVIDSGKGYFQIEEQLLTKFDINYKHKQSVKYFIIDGGWSGGERSLASNTWT